ncbi:uncharacterized protein EAF02_004874 [Botrytis sinoallii]|uniref:uncharacterized protein n=1 Tax=Botrytis sinoallii TaxID=1463999 RepID=UPI001901BF5F|nr:uncharacterized protein EAF02_004874 [Botrytis sinoallii]KAF7884538.1 hypothetical protein EAF02_004874 [Botrytis sinoallii]
MPKAKRPLSTTGKEVKRARRVKTEETAVEEKQKQEVKTIEERDEESAKHVIKSGDQKFKAYSSFVEESPFPGFKHPTPRECEVANEVLQEMHGEEVAKEFEDENTPETIPHVLDAMIVAILSQATSWSNAKRAMNSMKKVYGSIFAYEKIMEGGKDKLQETIRCGGLHVRKSMIIMTILKQAKERHGKWDLDHMFELTDEEAMKELLAFSYIGPKSASVVMGWCLKRNPFTVDTHVYRIAGLWGWRPSTATREKTQSHLELMIPARYKFSLHFLLIQHGRSCPACIGGSKGGKKCTAAAKMKALLK